MKTFIANDIGEFLNAILDGMKYFNDRDLWWRGQPKAVPEWKLRPKIYRKEYSTMVERSMCGRFVNKARARYSKCPNRTDWVSWLFLMQHYGLPTRLLDWSESPLVALYFAVQEGECDGTLWGLDASILNKFQIKKDVILDGGNDIVKPLFWSAFSGDKTNVKIISVLTDQFDLRHMVQSSVFTIHGISAPLDELPNAEDFLMKIEIPKDVKRYFRGVLKLFGITESYLFPDLEHLAKEVKELRFDVSR
jgi:hypothetical protein